jgi:hypothetical protein
MLKQAERLSEMLCQKPIVNEVFPLKNVPKFDGAKLLILFHNSNTVLLKKRNSHLRYRLYKCCFSYERSVVWPVMKTIKK